MKREFRVLAAILLLSSAGVGLAQTQGAQFLATWDTDGDGTVTLAEATSLRTEIFQTYDLNGDGLLSADERDAIDRERLQLRDQDRDQTQTQDKSGKGSGKGNSGQDNSSGQGSATNQRMMSRTQLALSLGDDDFAGTALDTDSDGLISLDEFLAGTATWLARLDKTGDGVITTDDFGK